MLKQKSVNNFIAKKFGTKMFQIFDHVTYYDVIGHETKIYEILKYVPNHIMSNTKLTAEKV